MWRERRESARHDPPCLSHTFERHGLPVLRRLTGGAAMRRLENVLGLLPAVVSRQVHFELPLRPRGERLDLILALDGAGMAVVAGENPVIRLPTALAEAPGWTEVSELCRRWRRGQLPAAAGLEKLWIELDLPPGREALEAAPRLFLDLVPHARKQHPGAVAELAGHLLTEVSGQRSSEIAEGLQRLLRVLPEEAWLYSLGVATRAEQPILRICVRALPPEAWPALLERAGVPVATADLGGSIDRLILGEGDSRVAPDILHFDLTTGGRPTALGLEVGLGSRGHRPGPYLEHLERLGWTEPGLRQRLGAWEGRELASFAHEVIPSRVDRRLNHLKLVLGSGHPARLKAYLRHVHAPSRRAARGLGSFAVSRSATPGRGSPGRPKGAP
ncbi:MAG: hypothetical protein MI919_19690 [Holophagales bacterium]|nr:hypothetical protein [Holophagales bacterium]